MRSKYHYQPHSDMRTLRQSKLSDSLMVTQIISDQIMNQDKQREEWGLSSECMLLGSVSSQRRFGATDIKALGVSPLWGLGQTVL